MAEISFSDIAIVSCGTLTLELNHLRSEGFLDTEHLFYTTPGLHEDIPELERQLLDQTYTPGPFRVFVIHEPKRRVISAAPFRDRVVHHALCNVIESKNEIYPVSQGIPFLGYRIFPTHVRLDKRHAHRVRRRLRQMQAEYADGWIGADVIRSRLVSWMGHAWHANSYRLVTRLLWDHPFTRRRNGRAGS